MLIWSLELITGIAIAQDYDEMGLYREDGLAVFRWSEQPLTGYKHGIILELGNISKAFDSTLGGGIVEANGLNVITNNTTQLAAKMLELRLNPIGFTGIVREHDTEAGTEEVIYTGTVQEWKWGESEIDLNLNASFYEKRRADIGNDDVPVTIGESDPETGAFFKFAKVLSVEDLLDQRDIGTGAGEVRPGKMDLFPVIGTYAVMLNNEELRGGIYVRLGYMDEVALTDENIAALEGKFVLCKEGPTEAVGKYRKIYRAFRYGSGNEVEVGLDFSDYWPVQLVGNYDGTAENQTWIQIVDIQQQFEGDKWQCDGFYDSDGNQLVNAAEIYSKNDDIISRLPAYGSDIDVSDTLNTTLIVDPKHFNSGIEKLNGYLILPVENFGLYSAADLSPWNSSDEAWWENYARRIDGIFEASGISSIDASEFISPESAVDKNSSTFAAFNLTVSQTAGFGSYYKVFRFTLPKVASFSFSRAYIGIKLWSKTIMHPDGSDPPRIMARGYIDRRRLALSEMALNENASSGASIDCIPDFYYLDSPQTANKNFYMSAEPDGNNEYSLISGVHNFDLGVDGPDSYNAIEECVLTLKRVIPYNDTYTDETKIYQLCVIFESEASLKEVFV